jgi:CarD family transcriptional regulator
MKNTTQRRNTAPAGTTSSGRTAPRVAPNPAGLGEQASLAGTAQPGPSTVSPSRVTFKIGDRAVHPSHGVGELVAIEAQQLAGRPTECYVFKIFGSELKVMVPTAAAVRVGLRPVMKKQEAQQILDIFRSREVAVDLQPWSRRFRVYTDMVKSGLPTEIAKVLRDMYRLKLDKELSFGERRLLDQARNLLIHELALAKRVEHAKIEGEIHQMLQQ